MPTLKEIVVERLEELGLSAIQAAERAGLNRSYIYDLVSRGDKKSSPRSDKMQELAAALYLDAGALTKGEMVRIPSPPELRPKAQTKKLYDSFDPDASETVEPEFTSSGDGDAYLRENYRPKVPGALPELDIKLGAGEGAVGEVLAISTKGGTISGHKILGEWLFPPDFLRDSGTNPVQSIVGAISGDSMIPNYLPSDRVLVDLSQNTMTDDGVYMFGDGENPPQIKRLQRIPFSKPVMVEIISDNPAYRAFQVELSRIVIYGRITWHMGRR